MKKTHIMATVGTLIVGMVLGFGVYVNAQEGNLLETLSVRLFGREALIEADRAFQYKDDLALNPGGEELESGPITGKITGSRLTAKEFNRLLELAAEGGANLPTCFEGETLVYDSVLSDWKCGVVSGGGLKQDVCEWTEWFRVESGNSPQLVPLGHYVAGADYQSTTGGNDGQLRIYHCEGSGGGTGGSGEPGVTDLITPNYTTGYSSYTGDVDASGYSFIEFGGFDGRAGSGWTGNDNGSASTLTPVAANSQAAINLGSDGEDAFILLEFDANKNMSFSFRGFTGGLPRLAFVRGINVAGGGTSGAGGNGSSPLFHICNNDGTAVVGKGTDEACLAAQTDSGKGTDRYRAMNCEVSDYLNVELASNMWYKSGAWSTQVSNTNVLCDNGTILVADLQGTAGTGGNGPVSGGGIGSWEPIDITGTEPFDASCEYRMKFANPDPIAGTDPYAYAGTVAPERLILWSGFGSSLNVRADSKTIYRRDNTASAYVIDVIEKRCGGGTGGGANCGWYDFDEYVDDALNNPILATGVADGERVAKCKKTSELKADGATGLCQFQHQGGKWVSGYLGTAGSKCDNEECYIGCEEDSQSSSCGIPQSKGGSTSSWDKESRKGYKAQYYACKGGGSGGTSGPGTGVDLKNLGCADGQLLSGFDENGDAKCTTINGGAEYTANPPMIFELNKGSNTTDWTCWDNIDLKDYCGDFDGCTIKMIMNHKTDGNDQVRIIDQHIYMEEPDSFSSNNKTGQVYGWNRQSGGGDYSWINGTGTRLDTITGPWNWAYIFNYKHNYCPEHSTHKAYPANEPYKFSFMTHPHVRTRYIVYDSLSDQAPIEVIQDCASQDGVEVDGKCILPRTPLKDLAISEYGEGGTRSPADTPRNYAKLIQNNNLDEGKKYAFILATSGERMGERTILTDGVDKNKKMKSRCYNSGYLSGNDIKFSHMDGTGAPGNGMISYQGTFEYGTDKTIPSYTPLGTWGDFMTQWTTGTPLNYTDIAAYTSACSDPGKGGYMMYIFEYDELKNIMDAFYARTGASYHKFNDPLSSDPALRNNHWIK